MLCVSFIFTYFEHSVLNNDSIFVLSYFFFFLSTVPCPVKLFSFIIYWKCYISHHYNYYYSFVQEVHIKWQ